MFDFYCLAAAWHVGSPRGEATIGREGILVDLPAVIPQQQGQKLSFGVLTVNSAAYIEKLLRVARTFADEIVIGVDSSSSDATEAICCRYADKISRLEPIGTSENALAWLNEQCSGDWIFRLDHDELPSEGLLSALPRLMTDREVTHYWFPRRWVIGSDESRWIAEPPWWPDWQVRLFRNIRSIVKIPGVIHSDYVLEGSGAYLCEGSIYHYDLTYHSEARRRQKIEQYERLAPGGSLSHYYFPDVSSVITRPLAVGDPPAEARDPEMRCAPRAVAVPFVSAAEIRRVARQECNYDADLFRATITCVESLPAMRAKQLHFVELELHNQSEVVWPGEGLGVPEVHVSYHWLRESGEVYKRDGLRTPLPRTVRPDEFVRLIAQICAPSEPGNYILHWDLVIEGVAWFSDHDFVGPRVRVPVQECLVEEISIDEFTRCGPLAKYLRASAKIPGWLRGKEAKAMASVVSSLSDDCVVVEIGSFLGSSSVLLAGARKLRGSGKLYCVDPFDGSGDAFSVPIYNNLLAANGGKPLRQCFDENIHAADLEDWVEVHQGRADEISRSWRHPIDLLFLDGDHSPQGARLAYESWSPMLKVGGIIAIHISGAREYAEDHNGSRLLALEEIHPPVYTDIHRVESITFARKVAGDESFPH